MSEIVTGKDLKKFFQKCSQESSKIFIESPTDEAMARNIAMYFNSQKMDIPYTKMCIEFYIQTHKTIGVSLSDFALQLDEVSAQAIALKQEQENIRFLLEKTKKRMEGLT